MAKFEIEAKIGANSSDFQKKLKAASAESREFARSVKENIGQGKDVFGELAGAAGLGKFTAALGGGAAAAGLFGAAIIEACKGGIEAYSKLEESAFKFGEILHDPAKGQEIAKSIEEMPGHMGDKEQLNQGMISLLETFSALPDGADKAKAKLLELANVSAKTGDSIADLAEQYRRFSAGGSDASAGGAKLLKSMKELAPEIEAEKKKEEEALQRTVNYFGSRNRPEEVAKIAALKAESNVDFIKTLTPKKLDEMMAREYGPGGASGGAADAFGGTIKGKEEDLGAIKERLLSTIGEAAAPALKVQLDALIADLPSLTKSAQELGEAFGAMLPSVKWLLDLIDGVSPRKWGEDWGKQNQERINKGNSAQLHPDGSLYTPLDKQMNQRADDADRDRKSLGGHGTQEYLKSIAQNTQETKEFLKNTKTIHESWDVQ